jgi:hypothetical protein
MHIYAIREETIEYTKRYLLKPELPYNISIFRILFFLYLILIYTVKYFNVLPTLSLNSKFALPLIGWLINLIQVSAEIYTIFYYIGVISCLFIVIGYKTRIFLIINAVCVFYLIATPNFFGKLWHEQIVIWIAWIFTFSKCYDVFSIDALINKNKIYKNANYTFPIRLIWLQLGIIYFWAGFYKLWDAGFDWALSESMINQVQLEWVQNYDKIPSIRIDKYPYLLHLGGMLVILFEILYLFLLFKPRFRWIPAIGGLLMHNIIGYFMYISFFFLLQIFYLFYFNFNTFFNKININAIVEGKISKLSFYIGAGIISINFLFGMFNIDSYPFSAYPKYAAIIPNNIKIIHFHCEGLEETVHNFGKKNGFMWEDYGWLEHNIIRDYENGDDVQKKLEDYWAIWKSRNSQLDICDTLKVYLQERPVAPEGINNVKFIGYMGTLIHSKK